MSTAPNTAAPEDTIVLLLQATGLFNSVELGEPPDYTDLVAAPLRACASVTFAEDDSEHDASGGQVNDTQGFRVRVVISLADHHQAELDLRTIRDTIVPIFQKHSTLQDAGNTIYSLIKKGSQRPGYLYAEGNLYRAYEMVIEPTAEWFVAGGVVA
jgi:hypothetical protein